MIRKPFDPKLYAENDKKGKEAALDLLIAASKKYEIIENPNKRGVDLLIFKKGILQFYAEIEIKKVWSTKGFPFENVNIPQRKGRYTTLDAPTLFIMFNADQTSYLCITSKDLADSPLEVVPNRYIRFGEKFFKVDKRKVYFNNIKKAIKAL